MSQRSCSSGPAEPALLQVLAVHRGGDVGVGLGVICAGQPTSFPVPKPAGHALRHCLSWFTRAAAGSSPDLMTPGPLSGLLKATRSGQGIPFTSLPPHRGAVSQLHCAAQQGAGPASPSVAARSPPAPMTQGPVLPTASGSKGGHLWSIPRPCCSYPWGWPACTMPPGRATGPFLQCAAASKRRWWGGSAFQGATASKG